MKYSYLVAFLFIGAFASDQIVWRDMEPEKGETPKGKSLWGSAKGENGGGAFIQDCSNAGGIKLVETRNAKDGKFCGQVSLTCLGNSRSENHGAVNPGAKDQAVCTDCTKIEAPITKMVVRAGAAFIDKVDFFNGGTLKGTCGSKGGSGCLYSCEAPKDMVLCAIKGQAGCWMDRWQCGFCMKQDCKYSCTEKDGECEIPGGAKCGRGTQKYRLKCLMQPKFGGKACPSGCPNRPCSTRDCCCATIYDQCDYKGKGKKLCEGSGGTGKDLSFLRDQLFSIQVDPGCMLTLYQRIQGGGKWLKLTGNTSCSMVKIMIPAVSWSDQVHSFEVKPCDKEAPGPEPGTTPPSIAPPPEVTSGPGKPEVTQPAQQQSSPQSQPQQPQQPQQQQPPQQQQQSQQQQPPQQQQPQQSQSQQTSENKETTAAPQMAKEAPTKSYQSYTLFGACFASGLALAGIAHKFINSKPAYEELETLL